jgi:dihydroneopterin aldolase
MHQSDVIIIHDLEVRCHVGVSEAERAHPQRLLLTLEMGADTRPAAVADDLSLTIDYFAVCQRLLTLGEGRHWRLIETLAEEIAGWVLHDFGPGWVAVEVKKFIIPEAGYVAVRIRRNRDCASLRSMMR